MKKGLLICLILTQIFGSAYLASADSSQAFQSQLKYFNAVFKLQQANSSLNAPLAPGKTTITMDVDRVVTEFVPSINIFQEEDNGRLISNGAPEYCKVKPKLEDGLPGLQLPGNNGYLFNIHAGIEISDQPDFNRAESNTFYQVYVNIPLNSSGRDYLDYRYDEVVLTWDKNNEKFLSSKFITRSSRGGYAVAPLTFDIENTGKLYVKTVVEFSQNISEPICPKTKVSSWSPAYTLELQQKITEIQISKQTQQIIVAKQVDIPLTNKIIRLKLNATSGLAVSATELDSGICISDRDLVYLIKSGNCVIKFSQVGDDEFEKAPDVTMSFRITDSQPLVAITCVKGKRTKKVTAVKPVCPAGYKKK